MGGAERLRRTRWCVNSPLNRSHSRASKSISTGGDSPLNLSRSSSLEGGRAPENPPIGAACFSRLVHDGPASGGVHSDGRYVATAGEDRSALSSTPPVELSCGIYARRPRPLRDVQPDGVCCHGSEDATARIFDASAEERLGVSNTERGVSVAFSPDGRRLATGSYDNAARVFDAMSGKEMSRLCMEVTSTPCVQRRRTIRGHRQRRQHRAGRRRDEREGDVALLHEGPVNSATFSADGACRVGSTT